MTSNVGIAQHSLTTDGAIVPTAPETELDKIIWRQFFHLNKYLSGLIGRSDGHIEGDIARLLCHAKNIRELAESFPASTHDLRNRHTGVPCTDILQYYDFQTGDTVQRAASATAGGNFWYETPAGEPQPPQRPILNRDVVHGPDTDTHFSIFPQNAENHPLPTFDMRGVESFSMSIPTLATIGEVCPPYHDRLELQRASTMPIVALQTTASQAIARDDGVLHVRHTHNSVPSHKTSISRARRHAHIAEVLLAVVGDDESFRIARTLCTNLGHSGGGEFSLPKLDLLGVVKLLSCLETEQYQVSIKRRMLLLRLLDLFQSLCREISHEVRDPKNYRQPIGGRIKSQALDQLAKWVTHEMAVTGKRKTSATSQALEKRSRTATGIQQTSSTLQELKERSRKSLKNQLQAAKHWAMARDRFGSGIVALFPVERDDIANTAFETLPEATTQRLLDAIEDKHTTVGCTLKTRLQEMTSLLESIYHGEAPASDPGL